MVAKFYDPLYHDHDDGNPFRAADYDYSHECASYKRLSELGGSVLPRFIGSYTFKTKIGGSPRQIRLILIERVNGLPMSRLEPNIFSTEKHWIDWPWQKWLEVQYKETESAITDEQRQRWPVYDWMLEITSFS
ncbi:hypothetical protein BO79DRAFT_213166 [Aspergillus costaricaensis CBS 115574]|uniref:Uncharacterized protein n=1 Tax=Aspergillus costaricaensis CBS 115574 TaxID=1448317 RepID=A0ACD1ISY1_9EURO|nr:hypothetical protein BO79DRAFT_213166 [Aspergillus costaricaensis CBS 115574]RAK93549.1 hypothetical protein BO79DRAFT_213166 [Aspergillus costaricaensis CBS 115574]